MSDLREYVKLRYMGDCKCGDCQLVPTKVLFEQDAKFDALVKALVSAQRIIERDFPNGQLAIDIRHILDDVGGSSR